MGFQRWWIAAAAAIAVCGAGGVRGAAAGGLVTNVKIVRMGAIDLSSASIRASGAAAPDAMARAALPARAIARARAVNRRIAASAVLRGRIPAIPDAASLTLARGNVNGYFGFSGLTALDSDIVNQVEGRIGIEPPDQGLCVGDNTVVETVNLVFATYDLSGNQTSGPMELNALFGVPETDFLSDPRCYYDAPSRTFFLIATDLGATDPQAGVWSSTSSLLIGVMPAGGTTITTYEIDSTDLVNAPICPCFEDQPLLGADRYGIYISGNEFALSAASMFNGAEIYAINKSDLLNGASNPGSWIFEAPIPLAESTAASVQPAVPANGQFDTSNNGTEYLVSSLDFNGVRDNRIALWAITNTCGIPLGGGAAACNSSPVLSLPAILTSKAYGVPPQAHQMKGEFPVGQSVRDRFETIDTGDDRMQQVVYAGGNLYAGLNTVLKVRGREHTGILYFIIQPSVTNGIVGGSIATSGYAALAGADLYYPSIAANASGSAVMAFSLSGPRHFPSSAYIPLSGDLGAMTIHIGKAGAAPDDGVSGYRKWGGAPPARWGDYSAAFADENGNLWMASEYAGPSCKKAQWEADPTCRSTRGELANWATNIGEIPVP